MIDSRLRLLLMIATSVAGCTHDQVVGRFSRATCETIVVPHLGDTPPSGITPVPAAARPCASVLPTASASAFTVATPAAAGAAQVPAGDEPVFHRTMIVTVRKEGQFNPADRLEATDVTIRPRNARFEGWDAIATAYTAINAGSVQLSQARGFTESLTAGTPASAPASGSLSLGASQTDTRNETFTAQSQAETLTATLSDGGTTLRIHRQGGYGIDLTGNTVLKVDLAYDGSTAPGGAARNGVLYRTWAVRAYADAKGHRLQPRALEFVATDAAGLPPGTPVQADVYLTYTLRHVISGEKTYEERDDVVREITAGPVGTQVTLISSREAAATGFGLVVSSRSGSRSRVSVRERGGRPEQICFSGRRQAEELVTFLQATPVTSVGPLANVDVGILRLERNPDDPPLVPLDRAQIARLSTIAGCF